MRRGSTKLKAYKGRIGGHTVLMLNGFLTVLINWILLIIVLTFFTPAIFPSVDPSLAVESQSAYVFYYSIVFLHFFCTTIILISMLIRSILCPNTKDEASEFR